MTQRARARQSDISRALKAAKASGYGSARVEISLSGAIILTVSDSPSPDMRAQMNPIGPNEWDEVLTL
jgi:hypothetical protein